MIAMTSRSTRHFEMSYEENLNAGSMHLSSSNLSSCSAFCQKFVCYCFFCWFCLSIFAFKWIQLGYHRSIILIRCHARASRLKMRFALMHLINRKWGISSICHSLRSWAPYLCNSNVQNTLELMFIGLRMCFSIFASGGLPVFFLSHLFFFKD